MLNPHGFLHTRPEHKRQRPEKKKAFRQLTISRAAERAVLSSDVSVVEVVVVNEVRAANALEHSLEVVVAVQTELQLT